MAIWGQNTKKQQTGPRWARPQTLIVRIDSKNALSPEFYYEKTPSRIYWKNYTTKKGKFGESVQTWPQNLCFWAEVRKLVYTSCKPQFYYIKVELRGQNYIDVFSWWYWWLRYFDVWVSCFEFSVSCSVLRLWTCAVCFLNRAINRDTK